MLLCFYNIINMQEMKSLFVVQRARSWKASLVEEHATLASTRLSRTRRSRRGGVDDGGRESLRLGRDDDGDVDVACLGHLLACDSNRTGSDGRRRRSDGLLLGCRDGLRGGCADLRDGGSEGVVVGHGLGAVVGCALVETCLSLQVRSSLDDEGVLELFAGAAACCDFALEVEGGVESALAEGVEDFVDEATNERLLAVDDIFHDVVEVAQDVRNDACDRVLDVAGWFDGARCRDRGGGRDDIPGLGTLGYGEESSRVGDGGRLGRDRLCTSTGCNGRYSGCLSDCLERRARDVNNGSLLVGNGDGRFYGGGLLCANLKGEIALISDGFGISVVGNDQKRPVAVV
jgi:hypothetical protein